MDSECRIISNSELKGPYRRIIFDAPRIAAKAIPGQFVHVKIHSLKDKILRRPFSISDVDTDKGTLTLIYKVVGSGTEEMATLKEGGTCRIMGPLGKPYSVPGKGVRPILVAGGYGVAATYLLARRCAEKGVLLIGARTEADLILVDEYKALGFDVRIATNDGSAGHKGVVTEILDDEISKADTSKIFIYGCGPEGMLLALGKKAVGAGVKAELSLDQHMCCGVGACFACVVKVKDASNPSGFRYSRACKEGPVYGAEEVYYG